MKINLSLPVMGEGFTRDTLIGWCKEIDSGPFGTIACGDHATGPNPDQMTVLAAAAVVTERVRLLPNVLILSAHPTAVVAKQLASIDVFSNGRLSVGVGVGGREHDYLAHDSIHYRRRYTRLEEQVGELRALWAGEIPYPDGDPIGPPPVQEGGPPLYFGAINTGHIAKAARWADGITGYHPSADQDAMARVNQAADEAWDAAGRTTAPYKISAAWALLGGQDPLRRLQDYLIGFLAGHADESAKAAAAATAAIYDKDTLLAAVERADKAGCDEFTLVAASTDDSCLEAIIAALS